MLQFATTLGSPAAQLVWGSALVIAALAHPATTSAQGSWTDSTGSRASRATQQSPGTALGLSAAAALGIHGGYARVERSIGAVEGGATLDLGHIGTPKLRLITDVSYLRSAPRTERVESEGKTYRAIIQDLSGAIDLALLARDPTAILVPFVSGGVGLHVLSSAFQSLTIDTRYNTNNFSLQGSAGIRMRLGSTSRRALVLSVQRVQANNVSRTAIHLGLQALFNDLARGHQ